MGTVAVTPYPPYHDSYGACLVCLWSWIPSPALQELGMVMHACNSTCQEDPNVASSHTPLQTELVLSGVV